MSKKAITLTLSVVLILSAGMFFLYTQNGQIPKTNEPVPVVKTDISEQKSVRVSDGVVAFSFEVPKEWLVETRNDGEKPMTESELREFLATSYGGDDPKAQPDKQVSDYAHLSWNRIQKMTLGDLEQFIAEREKSVGAYPSASVSSFDHIWYTDGNAFQVDFYITDYQKAQAEFKKIKNQGGKFSEEVVGGVKAQVLQYAVDHDENGKPQVVVGATGGKKYYIFLPEIKKTLVIEKQALGDEKFEENFKKIIETLEFSNK